jgi:hypothetical protein
MLDHVYIHIYTRNHEMLKTVIWTLLSRHTQKDADDKRDTSDIHIGCPPTFWSVRPNLSLTININT